MLRWGPVCCSWIPSRSADDSGGAGSDCTLGGICSGVRTGDAVVVVVGVPKLKPMVALEKEKASARTAVTGMRAMAVAGAGGATKAGMAPQLARSVQQAPA
jgi:hypothetical protein